MSASVSEFVIVSAWVWMNIRSVLGFGFSWNLNPISPISQLSPSAPKHQCKKSTKKKEKKIEKQTNNYIFISP